MEAQESAFMRCSPDVLRSEFSVRRENHRAAGVTGGTGGTAGLFGDFWWYQSVGLAEPPFTSPAERHTNAGSTGPTPPVPLVRAESRAVPPVPPVPPD